MPAHPTSKRKLPAKPEPAAKMFAITSRAWANGMAMMLGAPIYLVGSALRLAEPGDLDIRVPMRKVDVLRLFGADMTIRGDDVCPRRWWRIERFNLKQSRRASRMFGANVDFQITTHDAFFGEKYARHARLRLDRASDEDLDAGLGDP